MGFIVAGFSPVYIYSTIEVHDLSSTSYFVVRSRIIISSRSKLSLIYNPLIS